MFLTVSWRLLLLTKHWKEKYLELMQVAGGEEVEDLLQDRDFWQEQTYKLLRTEE